MSRLDRDWMVYPYCLAGSRVGISRCPRCRSALGGDRQAKRGCGDDQRAAVRTSPPTQSGRQVTLGQVMIAMAVVALFIALWTRTWELWKALYGLRKDARELARHPL